jgi:eukaryotic-like serine/threonine-protein kinase
VRPRRRLGLIAAGIVLAAVLLGGLGVWAYVEYGSGAWYQDLGRPAPVAADPAPPVPADDAVVAAPDPPAPPEPRFSPADIRNYVNSYDGGGCFFAVAASVGEERAELVAYASRSEAFETLRDAFRQRFGFDAAVELRQVSEPQCVVVDALSRLAGDGARQPVLTLNKKALRSGETLQGTVSGLHGRHLAVMMLDNYGFMHNLAGFTTREDDVVRLEMRLHRQNPADSEPQLIFTVASAAPLQSLDVGQLTPARQVIPALLEEIAATPAGLGTAIGYFSFGG